MEGGVRGEGVRETAALDVCTSIQLLSLRTLAPAAVNEDMAKTAANQRRGNPYPLSPPGGALNPRKNRSHPGAHSSRTTRNQPETSRNQSETIRNQPEPNLNQPETSPKPTRNQ